MPGGDESWLVLHEEINDWVELKNNVGKNYRALFEIHLDDSDLSLIRKAAHYCQPAGDDRFKETIENKYGIKPGQTRRGRPGLKKEEVVNI